MDKQSVAQNITYKTNERKKDRTHQVLRKQRPISAPALVRVVPPHLLIVHQPSHTDILDWSIFQELVRLCVGRICEQQVVDFERRIW